MSGYGTSPRASPGPATEPSEGQGSTQPPIALAVDFTIRGHQFTSIEKMETQLTAWENELSKADYTEVMEDLCSQLAAAAQNNIASWLAIKKMVMDRARRTIPRFHMERFEKEADANRKRLENNRKVVGETWGSLGLRIIDIRTSSTWNKRLGQMAREIQDYATASRLIARCVLQRLAHVGKGRSASIEVQPMDVNQAWDLWKKNGKDAAHEITAEELDAACHTSTIYISSSTGLPTYEKPRRALTAGIDTEVATPFSGILGQPASSGLLQRKPMSSPLRTGIAFSPAAAPVDAQDGSCTPDPSVEDVDENEHQEQATAGLPRLLRPSARKENVYADPSDDESEAESVTSADPAFVSESIPMAESAALEQSMSQSHTQTLPEAAPVASHSAPPVQNESRDESTPIPVSLSPAALPQPVMVEDEFRTELPPTSAILSPVVALPHPAAAENESREESTPIPGSPLPAALPRPIMVEDDSYNQSPPASTNPSPGLLPQPPLPQPVDTSGSEVPAPQPACTEQNEPENIPNDDVDTDNQPGCVCITHQLFSDAHISEIELLTKSVKKSGLKAWEVLQECCRALRQRMLEAEKRERHDDIICPSHLQKLVSALGLVDTGLSRGRQVKRLTYIALRTNSYEDFKLLWHHPRCFQWFRGAKKPESSPPQRNLLEPWRIRSKVQFQTWMSNLTNLFNERADDILLNILSIATPDQDLYAGQYSRSNFLDNGSAVLSGLFTWLAEPISAGQKSIFEQVMWETNVVPHHLRHTHEAEQSIVVYGQQYSLLQQLIQPDPCFFLLSLLAEPAQKQTLAHVSFPHPAKIIMSSGPRDHLVIPADWTTDRQKWPNLPICAIVPVTVQSEPCTIHVLSATRTPQGMDELITTYNKVARDISEPEAPQGPSCHFTETVMNTLQEQESPVVHQETMLVPTGSIALLRGNVGWSLMMPTTGQQVVLQPQLLPLDDQADVVMVTESITERKLQNYRREGRPVMSSVYGSRYTDHRGFHAWSIPTRLPGVSPLSEAIEQQRSWTDAKVLIELNCLLNYNRDEFHAYIQHWRTVARTTLLWHLHWSQKTESAVFGERSYSKDDGDIEAEILSDIEEGMDVSASSVDSNYMFGTQDDRADDDAEEEDYGEDEDMEEDEPRATRTDVTRKHSRDGTGASDGQPSKHARVGK
jgi:hypothetical protein